MYYLYKRYNKNKTQYYYSKYSHYRKVVKFAITSDPLNRYKYTEDDPKTQITQFCISPRYEWYWYF